MRSFLVSTGAALIFATHAQADSAFSLATNLGTIIGSEKLCELSFDQVAIQAWIKKNVPAENLDFAPLLGTMIEGVEYNNQSKTGSAKTAHCAQIKRSATALGFIK